MIPSLATPEYLFGAMADSFRLRRTDDGDQTVLRFEGKLDEFAVPMLRPAAAALVADNRRDVQLEISKLDEVDCNRA